MITEAEATRLLKRADPARFDDRAPFVDDAARYLAALRTRSTNVTLIVTEPTPNQTGGRRRWPIIAVAAAAVVAIVVGALMFAARDDSAPQVPADTTVAPDAAAGAEGIARGFVDAWGANDAQLALTNLADYSAVATPRGDTSATGFASLDELGRWLAWNEAARFKVIVTDCARHDNDTEAGPSFRCGYDFHGFGSDAIGLGPYGNSYWDITVRDGTIVSASQSIDPTTSGFFAEMWGPFADWLATTHPDDVLVMFATADGRWLRDAYTEEAIQLWAQRTEEYVHAVLTSREVYAADVRAICATQAAQLGELAVPAEVALDQVAAGNTAAAAILEQTSGELRALDAPLSTDTTAYRQFRGELTRLVRIAKDSAEAATMSDSTGLAELDAEYREVRRAMTSGEAGSGLEECLASLPS